MKKITLPMIFFALIAFIQIVAQLNDLGFKPFTHWFDLEKIVKSYNQLKLGNFTDGMVIFFNSIEVGAITIIALIFLCLLYLSSYFFSKLNSFRSNNGNIKSLNQCGKILSKHVADVKICVGRNEDLKKIKKKLNESKTALIINGIGGVGKTTVVRRFIHKYENCYDHIVWAQISKGIKNGLISDKTLCTNLNIKIDGIKDAYAEILNRLNNLDGHNLMVLDDAKADMINEELPKTNNWKILITSRMNFDYMDNFQIGLLSPEKAVELFYEHYKVERNDEIVKLILEPVDYHSLTTELFAKSSNKRKIKLNDLKESIEVSVFNIKGSVEIEHSNLKVENILNYMKSVFPLSKFKKKEKDILRYFALFPSNYIPRNDLEKLLNLNRYENAIERLVERGWLEDNESGFKMHQIIQQLIKMYYPPKLNFYRNYIAVVFELLNCNRDYKSQFNFYKWLPFGHLIFETFPSYFNQLERKLHYKFLELVGSKNNVKFTKEELDSAIRKYGEKSIKTAELRSQLAYLYWTSGTYKKSVEQEKQSLEIYIREHGEDHPKVAQSKFNLGGYIGGIGNSKLAIELLESAKDIYIKNFGKDYPEIETIKLEIEMIKGYL